MSSRHFDAINSVGNDVIADMEAAHAEWAALRTRRRELAEALVDIAYEWDVAPELAALLESWH